MIDFLIRKTIKNYKNIEDIDVRENYTVLSSIIGLITNFILIIIKLVIGIITSSVSIIANSIDSMSDFGSNIVTVIGSKIAKKPADKEHPFGHQRVEYITGLIVSMFIIFIGGSVFLESFQKIINFKAFIYSAKLFYVTLGILVLSIIIKIYQAFIYRHFYKITKSLTLKANFTDSFMDSISTIIIIIGLVATYLFQINNITLSFSIDGILGILESVLIVISGAKMVKLETDYLIGKPIKKEFADNINNYIKSFDEVLGTHDIMCHMYGPYKCYMTVHVEVNSKSNFIHIHDIIDEIEHKVEEKFNVNLTIHMDPVDINNPELNLIKEELNTLLASISNKLSYHDIRIVSKNKVKTLILDIVVPYDLTISTSEISDLIKEKILNEKNISLNVNYDRIFID